MSLLHHNSGFYFVLLTTAIGSSIGVSLGLYSYNLKRGNRNDYLKKVKKGKYNIIILAVVTFGIVIGFGVSRIDRIRMIPLENPDQAIIFNSPALETAIREYYELDQEEIRWRDIGYRTDLIIESSSLSAEITTLFDLHWFVNLENIQLFGRKISGNINDLDMLSRLTMLIMPETKVSGDIEVLISCPALEVIDLAGTLVEGDIGVFEYFPDSKLEYVNLSHTRVKGDIIHLASLENLTDLDFNNCEVTGDIDCFEGNQNLKMVDVSNTQVIGRWAETE